MAVYTTSAAPSAAHREAETRVDPPAKAGVPPPARGVASPVVRDVGTAGSGSTNGSTTTCTARGTYDSTVSASVTRQQKKDLVSAYRRSMRGVSPGDNLSKESANTCNKLKHNVYSCMLDAVVPMPGDGACAYHTMLYNLGLCAAAGGAGETTERIDAFRDVLYALDGDEAAMHAN